MVPPPLPPEVIPPHVDPEPSALRLTEARKKIEEQIALRVVGQHRVIELMLVSLLCNGHALLLGVPGIGKTLMAATLAKVLDLEFQRIQFTPDLLPADITGTDVIEEDAATGRRTRSFLRGPIFANFVLADEINRTPPKTQAALLQAMQEREVSVGRSTYPLPPPFMVLATQNPIEFEGTYPLPEAQLDRFMLCIRVSYPTPEEEATIVRDTTGAPLGSPVPVLKAEEILELQRLVRSVPVASDVIAYAVRIVGATRAEIPGSGARPEFVTKYLTCGASPRASQSLILAAKARALLNGRFHVDFADVRALAPEVLRHRLVLNYRSRADKVSADEIIAKVLDAVPEEAPRAAS
jgi:MoxR-like ATPase